MWFSGPQGHCEGGATPPVCKGTDVTSPLLTTQAAGTPDRTSLAPEERRLTFVYKTQAVLPGLEPAQQICLEEVLVLESRRPRAFPTAS